MFRVMLTVKDSSYLSVSASTYGEPDLEFVVREIIKYDASRHILSVFSGDTKITLRNVESLLFQRGENEMYEHYRGTQNLHMFANHGELQVFEWRRAKLMRNSSKNSTFPKQPTTA